MFDDVFAYDLWFPPPIKNPNYAYGSGLGQEIGFGFKIGVIFSLYCEMTI